MPEGDQSTGHEGQASVKTFTQEQLDQIVKDRIAREREKFGDYDTLKAAADKLRSIEDANKSEAEKVAQAIRDRDTRLAEMEAKAKDAEEKATGLMRQTKVVTAALSLGAYDASDPNFAAAVAGIDPASTTADSDIKAAIEALKASKPYLFKPAGSRGLEQFNPGTGSGNAETDAQRAARVLRQTQGAGKGYGPLG